MAKRSGERMLPIAAGAASQGIGRTQRHREDLGKRPVNVWPALPSPSSAERQRVAASIAAF